MPPMPAPTMAIFTTLCFHPSTGGSGTDLDATCTRLDGLVASDHAPLSGDGQVAVRF